MHAGSRIYRGMHDGGTAVEAVRLPEQDVTPKPIP
jgi:hypothetical protein